ncbi:MAG: M4 family metallopeptidase [Ginsengibacter sp.]
MGNSDSLVLEKETTDEIGMVHQRYQQYYKGVKVENAEYMIHGNADSVETMNGDFRIVKLASVFPSLTEQQALSYALKYVNAKEYKWQDSSAEKFIKKINKDSNATYYPQGYLVIEKDNLKGGKNFLLSWKFSIFSLIPYNLQWIYVDANTGQIINTTPQMLDVNTPLTAQTMYSGTLGITGGTVTGGYVLNEIRNGVDVHTLNSHGSSNLYDARDFLNTNTSFTDGNWTNFAQDQPALDAHWAEEKVLDFWKTVFNRNSLDNNGIRILGYVHFTPDGSLWNDAQWVGGTNYNYMEYGDGDGFYYYPFTSLDIAAHEMGHGIDEFTANLTYSKESGALNEGFSDIWAASIENWAAPSKQTWVIGEDITSDHHGFRSMSTPKQFFQPDTYLGSYWYDQTGCSPLQSNDYCGVHQNSGVLNHWYYLLSQGGCNTNDIGNNFYVHGIGITDAEKIAWRTESQYLTSSSDYSAASSASIQAAIDLFGANSIQVHSVTNAWYAVGIGSTQIQPSVSGADYFCSGSSTYSISELPQGSTVTYSISPTTGVANLSQTNNQATLTKSSIGSVILYATITTACGTQISISKNIAVGFAPVTLTSSPTGSCNGSYQTWSLSGTPAINANNWHWTVDYLGSNSDIYISQPYASSTFADVKGGGTIKLTYTDVCGNNESDGVTVYSNCYAGYAATNFTVAPNPAQNDVTVSTATTGTLTNTKTKNISSPNLIYGIKITDALGILRKYFEYKAGIRSIKISVADLNSGVYSLSVFDGQQWQSQNIVVQK